MLKTQADYYRFNFTGFSTEISGDSLTEVVIKGTSTNGIGGDPDLDQLSEDITLMNTIRNSSDPAVQDQFHKLLTTMAITHGRDIPAVAKAAGAIKP